MEARGMETATFAGGCFWCLEPVFAGLRGVRSVLPGYSGGHRQDPTYEEVCEGSTGHAEAVQITFDPQEISYRDLLRIFFSVHDPTTRNRQGADVGTQYRSAVFVHTPAQKQAAQETVEGLQREDWWEGAQVVTEVVPHSAFFPAEEYHREYFARHPERAYCRMVIAPKLARFRRKFASLEASSSSDPAD